MLDLRIDGVEDVVKKLSYLDLVKVNSTWIKKSTLIIQRKAQEEAPVDKGALRRAIKFTNYTHSGKVESKSPYGLYVHEGTGIYARNGAGRKTPRGPFHTRGQKANPFMERAFDAKEDDIKNNYRKILASHLHTIGLNK